MQIGGQRFERRSERRSDGLEEVIVKALACYFGDGPRANGLVPDDEVMEEPADVRDEELGEMDRVEPEDDGPQEEPVYTRVRYRPRGFRERVLNEPGRPSQSAEEQPSAGGSDVEARPERRGSDEGPLYYVDSGVVLPSGGS